ncbi:hypothetical protein O6H91_01G066000 [Diphasiastrum complanatum]|uniref:Uncharacterized protein n=1 Tax=Diphasiastrum complanatum TaxID=34168 RepID=A0ACC2ES30_DIPCM|nr:hypothetical protein O6H91_01G066000 [Diphasiastrum complanatum]
MICGLPQSLRGIAVSGCSRKSRMTFKAAYRRMARRYHPDVCAREEAQECTKRFIVLQEAYETLSDPWRRASYDRAMTNSLYSVAGGAWKREIS